ncbi:MAG: leucyl aminopeptidase, partial [Frankiaceae bacterium]|nr:leucyl aminopeptidase [Frankiaceae bacterium]
AGEVVAVPVGRDGVDTVLLAGVGDGSPRSQRRAGAAVARRAKSGKSLATTLASGRDDVAIRAVVEALGLASYTFTRQSDYKPAKLRRVSLVVDDPRAARPVVQRGTATIAAVRIARDLANTPSLEKSPQWMVDRCHELAAGSALQVDGWNEDRLATEGFGGILAVGRGSSRPPRLVQLDYRPDGATRHVVLVGKGITFDSGGLSLKPTDGMVAMKTDMSGGAAVIGAMSALRALGVRSRVTALVPLAENMPGADATRPGDVIRHFGGRTTEVLNTDAEGRLVLADALAYAVQTFAPDVIVDIATLTGAATLGLGKRHGALFSAADWLRDELVDAADAGGERLWPMPLVETYRSCLDSPVADLRNIGDPNLRYSGGAIVAALYLREFVGSVPWAHLDVAGPARADADEDEVTKGATGFGVRTFLRWLEA